MAAPSTKENALALRLSRELADSLELAAIVTGRSKSDLARELITQGLLRLAEPEELDKLISAQTKQITDFRDAIQSNLH